MNMKTASDRSKLLSRLFSVAKMGMEASEIILPRTGGKELRSQIRKQDENYINLMEKSRTMMKSDGQQPAGVSGGTQRMLSGAVKMATFLQHDPHHIAELMVRGTTMGILKMTEAMNHTPDCDNRTKRFAEDYIHGEEQNIDRLKRFL